jgi:LPS-assembly lipoprotein
MTAPQSLRSCPQGAPPHLGRPGVGVVTAPPRRALLLATAALLSGCGFKLRQAPQLPFRTLALKGFKPTSPMAEALRQALAISQVQVLAEAAQAEVVLEAVSDTQERTVVASTSAALVREIALQARLQFKLITPAGKTLIGVSEVRLTRDMTFNEKDALAKQLEEQQIFRAMQQDMALQVLYRLAALRSL